MVAPVEEDSEDGYAAESRTGGDGAENDAHLGFRISREECAGGDLVVGGIVSGRRGGGCLSMAGCSL